jgi:UDP-N-acetyl-D-mannosaminuronic acid dehydrogenase
MVKLMENTFRDVNIALANEFALIAEELGINVWEAIETANRHPRVKILRPGPGVGGHCIAVDPWFLVEAATEQARLIHLARLINDGMPAYTVKKVKQIIARVDNPIVACLGVTYKANVADIRESPSIEVIEKLLQAGLTVRVFDPHAKVPPALSAYWMTSLEAAITGTDLLVVLVDHDEFKQLVPEAVASMRHRRMLDTRNCLQVSAWRQAGCEVTLLGAA